MAMAKKRLLELFNSVTLDPETNEPKVMKGFKEPTVKELAEMADMAYEQRKERRAMQKKVDEFEETEKSLIRVLKGYLAGQKASTGIAGNVCRASTDVKCVPRIIDFSAAAKWAGKTGNFQIFQRRLNDAAVAELVADKKKVPGVEFIDILTISLEKV